jgi:thiol-disulfide isomerase/thioredoxin
MIKRISVLFFITIFFIACQTGTEDAKNFSDDYAKVSEKLRELRSQVKKRDDYVAYNAEKKREYENLWKEYEKSPDVEKIEILRSRLLLGLKKTDEAEQKIDKVLAKKPDLITEAKMVKVKILLQKKQYNEAYNIFKEIESQVTDPNDLYQAYYYLAEELEDNKLKEAYANKFLNGKQLPEDQVNNKVMMYLVLASIAKQEGDLDKAREVLNEGIADTKDERRKKALQNTLEQLDIFGKKAFPIPVGTWMNSSALKLNDLKGQVVVLFFWAPWCPSCRTLTPTIIDLFNENKDQEFTIIGFTRLYGTYSDDVEDKGKVNEEEELELIKKYVERKKIPYPIMIAEDKADLDVYKVAVLPTLVFIDKKGNVSFTKIGISNIPFIKQKIKQLLEET